MNTTSIDRAFAGSPPHSWSVLGWTVAPALPTNFRHELRAVLWRALGTPSAEATWSRLGRRLGDGIALEFLTANKEFLELLEAHLELTLSQADSRCWIEATSPGSPTLGPRCYLEEKIHVRLPLWPLGLVQSDVIVEGLIEPSVPVPLSESDVLIHSGRVPVRQAAHTAGAGLITAVFQLAPARPLAHLSTAIF